MQSYFNVRSSRDVGVAPTHTHPTRIRIENSFYSAP